MSEARRPGLALSAWMATTRLARPLLMAHLKSRLKRGKESPDRWLEKTGRSKLPRPDGPLVWCHAVGLGEVLALRALINGMTRERADLQFLVTSGTRASAEVFALNAPANCRHQMLPLDVPAFSQSFLDHWRPDLSIWAEQDIWPGIVYETDRRGIPLALVNARMNRRAFHSRRRMRSLFTDMFRRFALIDAQDTQTAEFLQALGAPAPITVSGSLKPSAPPLAVDQHALAALQQSIGARRVWVAGPTHSEDEELALTAQAAASDNRLLILAPRDPDRRDEIRAAIISHGLTIAQRSTNEPLAADTSVLLADTFGELGLWYRLADTAFIGGSIGAVEGHNPWEAARLECAVLHGPNVANFAQDYARLHAHDAARQIESADMLTAALEDGDLAEMAVRAGDLIRDSARATQSLSQRLVALLDHGEEAR